MPAPRWPLEWVRVVILPLNIGVLFRRHANDLRENPLIEVIEGLIGKGYDLRLYDKDVKMAMQIGANRDFHS